MAKTAAPGEIVVPGVDTFYANAMPDPFDGRDLLYRPRIQPLKSELNGRSSDFVYLQQGQSCTGHAVAASINHVLKSKTLDSRVSPYMLYRLARRYDEFPGEADAGSSLRGALKGWFNHGAALEREWPTLGMAHEPDPDDEENLERWRERPLGAFYRVNPFRLDDMQSAIAELSSVIVSGTIHEGWTKPVRVTKGKQEMYVIARPPGARILGGHAYCLAGYNEVGFLVQNSWGPGWGKRGFATLPYEDWLDSAYDAWVARPGVPHTPFSSGRTPTAEATGGSLATKAAPNLRILANHVVNTGNDGRLSETGRFASSEAQLDRLFDHMNACHEAFLERGRADVRHILLWAHGGGIAESDGLAITSRQLNWWLNLGVYPIGLIWETGPLETVSSALEDLVRGVLPAGGVGFDLWEQLDRLVEGQARRVLRWGWIEMKENAERASDGVPGSSERGGAAMLVDRLAAYADAHGRSNVRIHLAGHSAGSIYEAAMLDRFAERGLQVDTVTWLAPAISVARFRQRALPHLGPNGIVRRFSCFDLSDQLELNDTVGPVYHKSAVYLVARALEDRLDGQLETPVVGLAKCWDRACGSTSGRTFGQEVRDAGGELIVAKCTGPSDARTSADTHAAFDEDQATMTSVAMRVLDVHGDPAPYAYEPNATLIGAAGAPWGSGRPAAAQGRQPAPATREPVPVMAGRAPEQPGGERLVEREVGTAADRGFAIEPASAATAAPSAPILDVLTALGWRLDGDDGRV